MRASKNPDKPIQIYIVKYRQPVGFLLAILTLVLLLSSACRRINEATDLGDDLIPAIDNITTFETFLDIETDNKRFNDTTKVLFTDQLMVGHITSDPEFGGIHGNAYFNIVPAGEFVNPFINKDSVIGIDSVVLSLAYQGYYGDTNSFETLSVYEIAPGPSFKDTVLYKYSEPDFPTTGSMLGSKTFQVKQLDDTVLHIRKRDTTKLVNVIRIPITNALGTRFSLYDTSNTANGGFRNDSIFKTLFRGFQVKAENAGNALVYFLPTDNSATKLTVYYRLKRENGVKDTTSTDFYHLTSGQANAINRTEGGNYLAYLNNGIPNDDLLYISNAPGSYGLLTIPGLSTFQNAVIHRAEIIATPIRTIPSDATFVQPQGLYLDRINSTNDTALTFDVDQSLTWNGNPNEAFNYNLTSFGGLLKSDSTYRFNISRYIQNLVTNRGTNYRMRLYSPIRSVMYSSLYKVKNNVFVTDQPAYGRVVLAGGNYAVPAKRLRLRIVYSKL